MRHLIFSTLLVTAVFLGLNQTAFAVCTEGPPNTFTCDTNDPNPDPTGVQGQGAGSNQIINVLPGAGINTINVEGGNGSSGIESDDLDDVITVTDAEIRGQDDGIDSGNGNDTINISGSDIFGLSDGIETTAGNNTLNIIDSKVSSPGDAISLSGTGSSVISIKGSIIAGGSNNGIDGVSGPDHITLEDSTVSVEVGVPVDLRSGDDTLTLLNGVVIEGVTVGIDCGNGFDTIIFAMDVPPELFNRLSGELLLADPAGDSITINGLLYQWTDCELLVNELVPVRMTRPIPTLSEWGLIAMAGVLGVIGIIAVRRRYNITA